MALIDVHQHVIPKVYKDALARIGVLGSGENPWPAWSLERQLELMDELGIGATLISIASPGAYFGDIEFTRPLVKACNEAMQQIVSGNPGKFGAMGFVSLPDDEAACRDVEYALDVLKLDGINLQTHAGHRYLGHPEENELYAELDRRRAVVFVHPQRPAAQNQPGTTDVALFDRFRIAASSVRSWPWHSGCHSIRSWASSIFTVTSAASRRPISTTIRRSSWRARGRHSRWRR